MAAEKKHQSKKSGSMTPKTMVIVYGVLGIVLIVSLILIFVNKNSNNKDESKPDENVIPTQGTVQEDDFKINDDTSFKNKITLSDFDKNDDVAISQAVALYENQGGASSVPMIMLDNVDGKLQQPDLRPRIAAAKLRNDDTVGWFRIKNSNMNFAVVQSVQGNNYYTAKGYDKEYSYHAYGSTKKYSNYGVIWSSFENVFTSREELSRNTVLFGHNWENIFASPRVSSEGDIMFEQLAAYCYADYAGSHPIINFSIESEDLSWVVVSAFYTEDYWSTKNKHLDFDYVDANLTNEQTQLFIDEIVKRSEYTSDIELSADDKFLTLSTCTRAKGKTDTQRFVVVAKLLGADEQIPTPTYTKNPSPKAPLL